MRGEIIHGAGETARDALARMPDDTHGVVLGGQPGDVPRETSQHAEVALPHVAEAVVAARARRT